MTVGELIEHLSQFDEDVEVMIYSCSTGTLRTINSTPSKLVTITEEDAENGDCEDMVGEKIVSIGYGNY